ncbi:MAG: peroxidase-related enzyme [Lysobacterales bacterium]|uniref:peroxidase-related enzyme n=1 Tax=Hydrogenophaga sp. TaxID=1904254 RepID=UPI003D0DE0B9
MSWIKEIPPEQAEGKLGEVYAELQKKRGKVANILQVHSLRPDALTAHLNLYMDLLFAPGGLSRRQREMIAVVVSRGNNCDYCVSHHAEALARYLSDPEALRLISSDYRRHALAPADRALLDYAHKLTVTPSLVAEADISGLREHGFADADILLANLITAYFNFVNRIALGLGVAFTAEELTGYQV